MSRSAQLKGLQLQKVYLFDWSWIFRLFVRSNNYWLGGVWGPTSYMVLRGLTAYGKDDLAKSIAKKTCKNVATVFETTGTFWENYTPDLVSYGMPVKKYFCGWTALFPIAMYNKRIKET